MVQRWSGLRGKHVQFLGMPGEPAEWPHQGLARAISRLFEVLKVVPPAGGKYTSHSLRIWAHTEQILVGPVVFVALRTVCVILWL